MRIFLIAALASSIAGPALAQHAGHTMPVPPVQPQQPAPEVAPEPAPPADPHAGHDMGPMPAPAPGGVPESEPATDPHAGHDMGPATSIAPPAEGPPPAALSGPRHAADQLFDPSDMDRAREESRAEMGGFMTYSVMVDRLEARISDGADGYLWDAEGWYGGDINKLWIKTEGEGAFDERLEQAVVQALWSRAVTPWFDIQAGARYDFRPEPERGYLVLGTQGLAPYFFEIDAAAFLSEEGDLTARVEAEYDQLITQRLILQPRVELDLAAQDVEELGIGDGLSSIEAGLRLRYEIVPEFAPYVGVEYERVIGDTADLARGEGEEVDTWSFLVGLRTWF